MAATVAATREVHRAPWDDVHPHGGRQENGRNGGQDRGRDNRAGNRGRIKRHKMTCAAPPLTVTVSKTVVATVVVTIGLMRHRMTTCAAAPLTAAVPEMMVATVRAMMAAMESARRDDVCLTA